MANENLKKDLSAVKRVATFPTDGGAILINKSTGETNYMDREHVAGEISKELGLGDVVTYDVGLSGGVLVGNINGEGVMRYSAGHGVHTDPEGSAFNKNFGTEAKTVAEGDHNHGGFAVKTNNVHMLTSRFTGATFKRYTFSQLGNYANYTLANTISPAINVSLYSLEGSDYTMVDNSFFTVTITTREASTDLISIDTVTIGGLSSSKTYTLCILFKDDNGFNINSGL